ncbi:MAG: hypothetical protein J6J24_04420 [Clostridia bacterium]|nr:hypothetical protein [Clostridia bacterium]
MKKNMGNNQNGVATTKIKNFMNQRKKSVKTKFLTKTNVGTAKKMKAAVNATAKTDVAGGVCSVLGSINKFFKWQFLPLHKKYPL